MRVTINPAMLLYLNGLNSIKGSPNENYAREMMELFTLGVDNGYTERDVREQARALTGWTADYQNGAGWVHFHFKRENHDDAMKVVFGKAGPFNWKTAVRLCIEHPNHPAYFVNKLWSYFVPVPPDAATATLLQKLYVHSGFQIRPVVSAILRHPLLYEGPAHGQVARRLHGRPAAHAGRPDRDRGLDLPRRDGRAAALLPAERQRLERRPLARHLEVPRALADRAAGAPEARVQRRACEPRRPAAERPREARRPSARLVGVAAGLPADETRCSPTRRRRWPPRSPTRTGRRRSR